MADLPIRLSFFKKLELYQELKARNKRVGDDTAWSGEKEILRWAATEHRHLGTAIDAKFVADKILIDRTKYRNFSDDAKRSMENLRQRGWAELEGESLRFLREGLLMGEVIDDVMCGKCRKWKYACLYWLAWATTISGAVLIIAQAVKLILIPLFRLVGW